MSEISDEESTSLRRRERSAEFVGTDVTDGPLRVDSLSNSRLPASKFAGGSEREIPQAGFQSSNIVTSFGMTKKPSPAGEGGISDGVRNLG